MRSPAGNFGMLLLFIGAFSIIESAMIKPNPIISRGTGVTVKTSSSDVAGINDNKFGPYATTKWTVTDNSWAAIKVVSGTYSKVFISWNSPDTTWSDSIAVSGDSCRKNLKVPVDYKILTSSNSTTGLDGDWTAVDSVTGNTVGARGHLINFTGANWVKLLVTKGAGKIDEVEVFDASNGLEDSWFFMGTRVSALMHKGSLKSGFSPNVTDSNFANMIKFYNPTFTPAVIRGGIQCSLKSGDMARDFSKYLNVAGNVHFWAIEVGTYDAWGGKNDSVAAFTKNLKSLIDSCKAHGIQPIIARVAATAGSHKTPALWQVHADFLKAVDTLTRQNTLIKGADFYTYLTTGSGYLDIANDGVLPNEYGNFELLKVWALKMDTVVYKAAPVGITTPRISTNNPVSQFTVLTRNGRLVLDAECPGTATFFTTHGRIIKETVVSKAGHYAIGSAPGCYLVRFKSSKAMETIRAVKF
jgi:hypothetical protein